jgi:hypothetical protein
MGHATGAGLPFLIAQKQVSPPTGQVKNKENLTYNNGKIDVDPIEIKMRASIRAKLVG